MTMPMSVDDDDDDDNMKPIHFHAQYRKEKSTIASIHYNDCVCVCVWRLKKEGGDWQ